MFRKSFFSFFAAAAFVLTGALFVFGQASPVRGKVVLKNADGTTAPVAGATIDVYRTDLKSKLPAGKTNSKGEFAFAGFPLGQVFALSVSAPNTTPAVYPNIKGGMENITITVVPGDGKRFTEEEARQSLASGSGGGASNPGAQNTPGKPAPESAEAKKQREEIEKKNAEVNAENEKIKNAQEIINKSIVEGKTAFDAKNYDLAIAKYDEGYKASPTFVGTAPVLLDNKALSLTYRAGDFHNANISTTDPTQKVANKAKVKQDFADALDTYNTALQVIKNNTSTEVPAAKIAENKMRILQHAQITIGDAVLTESVEEKSLPAAKTLTEEYIGTETDAAKKLKAQTRLADMYRVAQDSENAIAEYRKALAISADDPDALAGLGLSLFYAGSLTDPEDTAKEQEGLNYMARFAEVAPENHPLKASVRESVEYLKTKKLTPEKTGKPAGKKKP